MKLRNFIEQLQQLDPDADVRVKTEEEDRAGITIVNWEAPHIVVRMIGYSGSGERKTVCLE